MVPKKCNSLKQQKPCHHGTNQSHEIGSRSIFSLFLQWAWLKQGHLAIGKLPRKNTGDVSILYRRSSPPPQSESAMPPTGSEKKGSPWEIKVTWVVVSNVFYFHPYLGKIPILTNIFQMGWNHQPVTDLFNPTVDGSEIRLTSWYGSLSHYLPGFPKTSQVVVWDFWTPNSMTMIGNKGIVRKKHISWIQFHGTNARWLPRYMNGLKFMVHVPKKTQRTFSFEGQPPKQGLNSNQNKGPAPFGFQLGSHIPIPWMRLGNSCWKGSFPVICPEKEGPNKEKMTYCCKKIWGIFIEFVFDTLLLGVALRVVARIYHTYNIV